MAKRGGQTDAVSEAEGLLEPEQPPAGTFRRCFALGIPLLGPLCASPATPTFDVVDRLLQVLALIQGLLMSCFAGNMGNHLSLDKHVDDPHGVDLWSQRCLSRAFDCTVLALLFTLVTYAYLVLLIEQEGETRSSKDISEFWRCGGKFIIAGIVVLTIGGALYYSAFAGTAIFETNEGLVNTYRTPIAAAVGVVLIHVSFSATLRQHLDGV
mmetsp:Transcript_19087/g.51928  ORF Transcript_19087/g.51928 Transcript_19087/m.51928 type:complete len:211 (-) Transcript_19087:103-735(-)|eukprot:CAMPEP_0171199656 /NCGR_PEP_ID=MMETSP0790-20130122/23575_1 /TAXON_ID=2925 /ORGANISM="Alexandrium catenella, Strain OF101" /LENGTH=210 /DNA_ID=CAMNT_0011665007 /DNA_START=77 /DNA_END=709 /DNA_ORIENTATION=+